MRATLPLSTLVLALGLSACADSPVEVPSDPSLSVHASEHATNSNGRLSSDVLAELAQVRRATARFHDIDAAMAAGYTVWSPDPASGSCPSSAEGKMGYHLVNTALRGSPLDPAAADAELDPLRPEMLLYEKRADGELHLVGVEYLVFQAAWEREHGEGAPNPELLGQTVPFSSHAFPPLTTASVPHYELHVWIWKPNPNGMFSHWNPAITC